MKRWASRRDTNEPEIIRALEAAGAAVQQLDPPLPDLLVSFGNELSLLEVKDVRGQRRVPHRGPGNKLDGAMSSLTPSQVNWWSAWKGKSPIIVQNAAEALRAIGARDIDQLIARSSLGHALRDIEERGIDAHLKDLEREMHPRRKTR